MEFFIWISQAAIPLFGFWLLMAPVEKFSKSLIDQWSWNQNFSTAFFRSVLAAKVQSNPEAYLQSTMETKLPLRLRHLWLGLRSLSFVLIFILAFVLWNVLPVSIALMLGLSFFILSQWWKIVRPLALFFLGLSIFLFGYENLLSVANQITRQGEVSPWIYGLATNYLLGALMGAFIGGLVRLITRLSGVAWWMGSNLMIAGVLSLGASWGFVLGDLIVGFAVGFLKVKDKDSRIRSLLGGGFAVLMLLLTTPFQSFILTWLNGQFGPEIRSLQLGVMVFLFLAMETALSLVFFHFYFQRQSRN